VPAVLRDGAWILPGGQEVAWYEVVGHLHEEKRIREVMAGVLGVYGVSDVVTEAFGQFERELFGEPGHPGPDL
jgi:hypothetical protein